ncbi:tetratricopeptide repeat-containing sulfotransferase family protein [Luteimonas terrae]|uniref:Tetratricopeptide (TPR) repeat protein n=1 Tax=Luteimonas terrae TaxID=1530191 RepID=A0ABU1Y147_9GAMM|nr:sulfotransferase [Luteimonas terrae]MDR7194739.1 tetratricopeptide (TPR) repeat protein [Luteimonas terrae]
MLLYSRCHDRMCMNATQSRIPEETQVQCPSQRVQLGYSMLRDGHTQDAVALGVDLVAAYPDEVHVLVFASETQFAAGALEEALVLTGRAVEASAGNAALKLRKAGLLIQMRRRQEALAVANDAADAAHALGDGQAVWQAASMIVNCNQPAAAIPRYQQAQVLLGDVPGLLYDLAVAQFFTGDFDAAEVNLDRMLALVPQAGHALYLRATLRRQRPDRHHVDDIARRIASGIQKPDWQAAAFYALAKELEDLGEDEKSFAALRKGARIKRATLQYDVSTERAAIDALCESYSTETMAALSSGSAADSPIFIVGMPRSGTTLVERMLVQTGNVQSAGEPLDLRQLVASHTQRVLETQAGLSASEASLWIDFDVMGRDYLQGVRGAAADRAVFIDKMPVNYLYCGLIRKALPNARIIHLSRDPLDSCYAVFKTLFFNAYHFSYDLDELAEYYIGYRRMMAHWHEVMPGEILDVRYEDLVTDASGETRRILEWCGLAHRAGAVSDPPVGTPAFVTASAAQVREPVHTRSVHNSRKHAERLATLVRRLQEAGIAVD